MPIHGSSSSINVPNLCTFLRADRRLRVEEGRKTSLLLLLLNILYERRLSSYIRGIIILIILFITTRKNFSLHASEVIIVTPPRVYRVNGREIPLRAIRFSAQWSANTTRGGRTDTYTARSFFSTTSTS